MKYEPLANRYFDVAHKIRSKKVRQKFLQDLIKAYGNEHVFRYAFLSLLKEKPKEATAFGHFYGYHSNKPLTYKEIACLMNTSAAYVSILVQKCYNRLYRRRDEYWLDYGYITKEELFFRKAEYTLRKVGKENIKP